MSSKEVDRLNVLTMVVEKNITQVKAAELLKVSDRQIRNLLKILRRSGPEGLVSKKRGRSSNRKFNPAKKEQIIKIICDQYSDFGPTLAKEKLLEYHNIEISRETLRQWMTEKHFWIPKIKRKKIHSLRQRKEYFGEMLQGDGSHHDWFENGCPCAFIYFIDDATGKITSGRFEKGETLGGYTKILKEHLERYGIPFSIYTDKFSVFETTRKKDSLTQFKRILGTLDIKWIGANSPQAKGRIERCNRTLQDRLVKELRLKNIKTIDAANLFLKEYIPRYNNLFSKRAAKEKDLHRPLDGKLDLTRTLSKYEERTTRNDFTFQFHNIHYKILECQLSGRKIEIRTDWDGNIRVFQKNKELKFTTMESIFAEQKVALVWKERTKHRPKTNHPWKQSGLYYSGRDLKYA